MQTLSFSSSWCVQRQMALRFQDCLQYREIFSIPVYNREKPKVVGLPVNSSWVRIVHFGSVISSFTIYLWVVAGNCLDVDISQRPYTTTLLFLFVLCLGVVSQSDFECGRNGIVPEQLAWSQNLIDAFIKLVFLWRF